MKLVAILVKCNRISRAQPLVCCLIKLQPLRPCRHQPRFGLDRIGLGRIEETQQHACRVGIRGRARQHPCEDEARLQLRRNRADVIGARHIDQLADLLEADLGAAELDLAFVAAGRLDGYWERNLSPWDIAAGQIMVRESGGIVTGIEGHDNALTTGNVVAGNEFVQAELVKVLKPL